MEDLIDQFNKSGVRYLLIGGQAMRLVGMPRFSMDWDFFVPAHDLANFEKLNNLLSDELREDIIPLSPTGEGLIQTFQTQNGIIQFHLLLPGIKSFDEAEKKGLTIKGEKGVAAKCLCEEDLLATKQAADRPQDQQDIEFLIEKLKQSN